MFAYHLWGRPASGLNNIPRRMAMASSLGGVFVNRIRRLRLLGRVVSLLHVAASLVMAAPHHAEINWCLLIPRLLIFASSVVRGIPSLPAAPDGPDIRPRLSSRAASIISLS